MIEGYVWISLVSLISGEVPLLIGQFWRAPTCRDYLR